MLVVVVCKIKQCFVEIFEGEVQNLNYQKELNLIRSGPLKGHIDNNRIIALSLSTETDKSLFDLTEARISLNKDLEIESKTLQLNTYEKTLLEIEFLITNTDNSESKEEMTEEIKKILNRYYE